MVVMANVRSYPFPPPLRMQATQTRGSKAPQPEASHWQALGACSNETCSNESKAKTPHSSFKTGACSSHAATSSSDAATSSVKTVPEAEQPSTPCSGCTLGADAPQDRQVLARGVPRGLSYSCCAHRVPLGLFYSSCAHLLLVRMCFLCASCRLAYRSCCCAHAGVLLASLYLLSSLTTVLSSYRAFLSSCCAFYLLCAPSYTNGKTHSVGGDVEPAQLDFWKGKCVEAAQP